MNEEMNLLWATFALALYVAVGWSGVDVWLFRLFWPMRREFPKLPGMFKRASAFLAEDEPPRCPKCSAPMTLCQSCGETIG